MAARLLSWPDGLKIVAQEPLSGPRTIGAKSNQALDGFTQTTSAAFGLWRWRFQFGPIKGQAFRRYRGWITALHGGANATRVPFCDPDTLSYSEMGLPSPLADQPWSNNLPWSNSAFWGATPPKVPVGVASIKDATTITLSSDFWGHSLGFGDLIGFNPLHFGLYMVTEAISPGEYRIWPPLRKAISTSDYATLKPTLAMRLESETAAAVPRAGSHAENLSITMIEVLDYDARDYFTE